MRLGYLLPLYVVFFACAGPKLPTPGEDWHDQVMSGRVSGGDWHDQVMSGHDLTPGKAALLEKKLEQDPHDLASRTQLLGYYFGPKQLSNRPELEARSKHILWLIRNRPEAAVLSSPMGRIHYALDPEGYSEGKKAWMDHWRRDPANWIVLDNAAKFFLHQDLDLAIELLQQGQSLDENDPNWPEQLGFIYSLDAKQADSSEMKTELAEKALVQYERAYDLSEGVSRFYLLVDLAKVAFMANQYEKAREYANTMLAEDSPNWNSGNRIHHGNLVLGRIALAEGDIEEAKRRLIAAGETAGSPQLDSFGPNMMLAKELLQKGEKEVVLEYFSLCSRFWEMGQDRLEEWSDQVQADRVPGFGGSL